MGETMGLYDTIQVYLDCPYCGGTVTEAQTKDLGENMITYKAICDFEIDLIKTPYKKLNKERKLLYELWIKGRKDMYKAPDGVKYVNVTLDCQSVQCRFDADRRDIKMQGCPSGFGRIFCGKLQIFKGCFISELKDIELDGYDEKYFASYKKDPKIKDALKKVMHICHNQEVIAVRNWNRYVESE